MSGAKKRKKKYFIRFSTINEMYSNLYVYIISHFKLTIPIIIDVQFALIFRYYNILCNLFLILYEYQIRSG